MCCDHFLQTPASPRSESSSVPLSLPHSCYRTFPPGAAPVLLVKSDHSLSGPRPHPALRVLPSSFPAVSFAQVSISRLFPMILSILQVPAQILLPGREGLVGAPGPKHQHRFPSFWERGPLPGGSPLGQATPGRLLGLRTHLWVRGGS